MSSFMNQQIISVLSGNKIHGLGRGLGLVKGKFHPLLAYFQ